MAKDPQKQRVYESEILAGYHQSDRIGSEIKDAQKYVDKVLKQKGVQKIIRGCDNSGARAVLARGIKVEGNNGNHAIMLSLPTIRITKRSIKKSVIVHEISHLLTWRTEAGHDADFTAVELTLARNLIGKEYAERLQASFNLHRVKVMGKTGKASIPRVPLSQKAWFEEAKSNKGARKANIKKQADFKKDFIATLEAGKVWKCAIEDCAGEGLGKITDRPWDSYEKRLCYEFECPVCGNNEWFTIRRALGRKPTMREVWLANCG